MDALRKQLQELDISISRLNNEMAETDEKYQSQTKELQRIRGDKIDSYNMTECEDLERSLKCIIDKISVRKVCF